MKMAKAIERASARIGLQKPITPRVEPGMGKPKTLNIGIHRLPLFLVWVQHRYYPCYVLCCLVNPSAHHCDYSLLSTFNLCRSNIAVALCGTLKAGKEICPVRSVFLMALLVGDTLIAT